jgi:prepilin-type N-terminal cleavage/methylation domain-containing protein
MSQRHSGFTLIELLIVVIMLGILSAVVIPQFKNVTTEAQESSIMGKLQSIREVIELYKLHHNDTFPDDDIVIQLTAGTKLDGTPGGDYGPYFRPPWPRNPNNDSSVVKVVSTMPGSASGSEGWIFDKTTGEIRANSGGAAPSGINWFDL